MESEKSIVDAAREGDIDTIHKFLQENPSILDDIAFGSPLESVLHVATKFGHVNIVVELMKHNHNMGRELDQNGYRPLDLAVIAGNVAIVKELLRLDPELCLLQGKDRRTALHYAASKGKVEVIDELVSTCPDCLKSVTFRQETALNLAVKGHQVDAFKVLIKWLQIHKLQSAISWADNNGDTVLHIAALKKQYEIIEMVFSERDLRAFVNMKAKNSRGLTAADILDILMENPDDFRSRELILQHAAAANPSTNLLSQARHNQDKIDYQSEPKRDWFGYFKFQVQRDSPSDTRNALLVIAALIATVTFQAGLTPPSGISNEPYYQQARKFGSRAPSYLFMFSNSLGFIASLSIIIYLTGGFPFQTELLISVFAMMCTYGVSVSSILGKEKKGKQAIGYIMLTVAFVLPFLRRWLPTRVQVAWNKCRAKYANRRNPLPVEN